MKHEDFRKIFRIIDEAIWDDLNQRGNDGELLGTLKKRLFLMDRYCEDAKNIIAAYIDSSSERIHRLVESGAFKRFPAATTEVQPELTASPRTPHWTTSEPHGVFSDLPAPDGHPESDPSP